MRGGNGDRHASGSMLERSEHYLVAFGVGENELLGEICQDADPIGARVDHKVDATTLTIQIEFTALVEDGRGNRENAPVRLYNSPAHDACSVRLRSVLSGGSGAPVWPGKIEN